MDHRRRDSNEETEFEANAKDPIEPHRVNCLRESKVVRRK